MFDFLTTTAREMCLVPSNLHEEKQLLVKRSKVCVSIFPLIKI